MYEFDAAVNGALVVKGTELTDLNYQQWNKIEKEIKRRFRQFSPVI